MILVTGATGTVGSALIEQLCGSGVPTRALVRSPERADSLRGYDCETAVGDLGDPASLGAALRGVDAMFLLSPPGPDQVALENSALDAAEQAGVRVVKLGVIHVDSETNPGGRFIDNHRQVLERLRSGNSAWTVLAPNDYMQNALQVAGLVQERAMLPRLPAEAAVSSVDARDIAAVAAHVLTSEGHEGRVYTVTGPEALTGEQVAERFSQALGREIAHVDTTPDQMRAALTGAGVPEWTVGGLLELDEGYRSGAFAVVTDEVDKGAGRAARTWMDFATDHRNAFA